MRNYPWRHTQSSHLIFDHSNPVTNWLTYVSTNVHSDPKIERKAIYRPYLRLNQHTFLNEIIVHSLSHCMLCFFRCSLCFGVEMLEANRLPCLRTLLKPITHSTKLKTLCLLAILFYDTISSTNRD